MRPIAYNISASITVRPKQVSNTLLISMVEIYWQMGIAEIWWRYSCFSVRTSWAYNLIHDMIFFHFSTLIYDKILQAYTAVVLVNQGYSTKKLL